VVMSLRVLAATAIVLLFLLKKASSKEDCMTHLESVVHAYHSVKTISLI
jgi:hypothetical protein